MDYPSDDKNSNKGFQGKRGDRFMIYLRDEETYVSDESNRECDERECLV